MPSEVKSYVASLRTSAQRRYAAWVWHGLTRQQETREPPTGVNQGMQRAIQVRLAQMAQAAHG
jgi:hypothetical protein